MVVIFVLYFDFLGGDTTIEIRSDSHHSGAQRPELVMISSSQPSEPALLLIAFYAFLLIMCYIVLLCEA